MSDAADFETLLRRALTPVDPPADLSERLEGSLTRMTEAAVDELESWDWDLELEAIGDPREWPTLAKRLVISGGVVAAGAGAGAALVLLRARKRAKRGTLQRALRR